MKVSKITSVMSVNLNPLESPTYPQKGAPMTAEIVTKAEQ